MDLQNYLLFLVACLDLILCIIVIRNNNKNEINISYTLFFIWAIFWTVGLAMFRYLTNYQLMFFWNRIFIIASGLIASSLLHFSFVFPYKNIRLNNLRRILIYSPNLLVILAAIMHDVLIKDIIIRPWGNESILGWGYIYFAIYFSIFTLWAFINLWQKHKESHGSVKQQILYVLLGFIFSMLFGATFNLFFILVGNYKYIWLGPNATFIMAAFTAYAIITHRLMDIKFVLRRYSVSLVSLSTIVIIAVAIKYFIERFYEGFSLWADFFILLGALFIYTSMRDYFYRLANKYFFSSLYDTSEVIAGLSDKLRSTLDVKKVYRYIGETLINAFHIKAFGILSYDKKKDNFNILYNNGFNTLGQRSFPNDPELHKLFAAKGETMVVEEVKRLAYEKYKPTIDLLDKIGVQVLIPLNIKDKTIGLIALSDKESKDMYNDEDLKVIKVIGAQAAIAIENALLYEETKNFSIKLEKEVDIATRDLRRANEELKKLDAAKSEFISIASHQLRTPLTVIKGYISMMLEGNFGQLTKDEMDSLEKVFESNERLIQLVENLLNISRIESGRLQFIYKVAQLENVTSSVAEELSDFIKKKKLYLEYKKPAKPLPPVKIDEEKIRQVIMNLIDNAIKYTKQGGVKIKVEQKEDNIRFTISDTGMGINPEDLANLFKKFSRGKGTSLIHTEGTGLGLYVAQMMVKAHGGNIYGESAGKGKGSKFYFDLPIYMQQK